MLDLRLCCPRPRFLVLRLNSNPISFQRFFLKPRRRSKNFFCVFLVSSGHGLKMKTLFTPVVLHAGFFISPEADLTSSCGSQFTRAHSRMPTPRAALAQVVAGVGIYTRLEPDLLGIFCPPGTTANRLRGGARNLQYDLRFVGVWRSHPTWVIMK